MRIAFLVLFILICLPEGLSFQRIRSKCLVFKASTPRRMALDTADSPKAAGFSTLLKLPKSSFKLDKVVDTIKEWGVAQSETGSAITSMPKDEGIEFSIGSQRSAFLAISAVDAGQDIEIRAVENLDAAEPRLQPLVRLASANLIDSICGDIGMAAMKAQRNQGDTGSDSSNAERAIGRSRSAVQGGVEVFDDVDNVVCIDLQSGEIAPMGTGAGHGSGDVVLNRGTWFAPARVTGRRQDPAIETVVLEGDQGRKSVGAESDVVKSPEPGTQTTATAQTQASSAAASANADGGDSDNLHGGTTATAQPRQHVTSFTPEPAVDATSVRPQPAVARSVPVIFDIPEDDSRSVREALQQADVATRALTSAPAQQSATGRDRDFQPSVPHKPTPFKRRDPETMHKAAQMGLNLERFEEKGIEDQALQELNAMLKNSRSEGFLSVIRGYAVNSTALEAANIAAASRDEGSVGATMSFRTGVNGDGMTDNTAVLTGLFQSGKLQSALTLRDILNRPTSGETAAQLLQPTPQLPMYLPDDAGSLAPAGERLDIFQSPSELYGQIGTELPNADQGSANFRMGGFQTKTERGGISYNPDPQAPPDPKTFALDQQRLYVLLTELNRTTVELQDSVIDGYRDLLLSENMLFLLKRANITTVDYNQRLFYQKITEKTIALTAELGALVKTESVRHLQTIQDVCEIAADFQHDEEKFLTRMQYIKPRFDTAFLAYLTYAMGEESTRMWQAGVDPTAAPSEWLKVLLVVKQGVVAEFEARYRQLLEPLLLLARFDAGPLRSDILKRFVAITPAMELPYLKALALNMIGGILAQDDGTHPGLAHTPANTPPGEPSTSATAAASAQSVFAYSSAQRSATPLPDPRLVPRMQSLRTDIDAHLSDDLIRTRIATFRAEVRAQGQEIVVRHRNPVMQDEMETHRELAQQQQQVRGGLSLPGFE